MVSVAHHHDSAARLLLLQVRELDPPAHHERLCFLERLGVSPEQLVSINVVREPLPSLTEARTFDLILLGGAGRFSATADDPFTEDLLGFVRAVVDADIPFFGSCYGHQFLARALGGRVECDPAREEIGTFDIELESAGRVDPLFAGMPDRFGVHLGHHDRVVELPSSCVSLAFSARCPHQMIRVKGRLAYGSQFHSEMSLTHIRERLLMYADEYLGGEDAEPGLDARLRPTPVAERILGRFLALARDRTCVA